MIHLTTQQLLQMIDGTLDYAAQAQCTSHLAVCERCRKEIDLQRSIAKIARNQPLASPSKGFAQRVMSGILPGRQLSWKTKVIDNLGNIIAMAMVLAVLGYAISTPSLFQTADQTPEQSIIPQQVTDTYAKLMGALAQNTDNATKQIVTSTGNDHVKTISLAMLSLLILAGIDQFVLKRYIGLKTKH